MIIQKAYHDLDSFCKWLNKYDFNTTLIHLYKIRCEQPIFRKNYHMFIRIKDEEQIKLDWGEGEFYLKDNAKK